MPGEGASDLDCGFGNLKNISAKLVHHTMKLRAEAGNANSRALENRTYISSRYANLEPQNRSARGFLISESR